MTLLGTQASALACEVIALVARIAHRSQLILFNQKTHISHYGESLCDFHDKPCSSFTAGLYETSYHVRDP
jgi:hypothetical protein